MLQILAVPFPSSLSLPSHLASSLSSSPQSTAKKKAPSSKAGAQDDLLLLFDDESSHVLLTAQPPAPLMPSMDNMLTPMTASMDINGGGGGAGGGVSYGRKYTVCAWAIVKSPILIVVVCVCGLQLRAPS